MKFLVVRNEALRNTEKGRINTSEMWPCIVEAHDHREAVEQAFAKHGFNPPGHLPKTFTVVAMIDAVEVYYRPKQNYEVLVTPLV